MQQLAGKKIFVTGGSRGIGASIVSLLAKRGATVGFSFSSNESAAKEVLASLGGDSHFCVQMDLRSEESVNQAAEIVLEKWESPDGLVNNAGITKDQLFLRMKTEDFDSVINTNLRGAFLVVKAFSRVMMKARKGSIVNISSVIGQTGNVGQVNYSAAKAGLHGMTKSLALEFAQRGVRVNALAPGMIATEMTAGLSEDAKSKILQKIPLERMGDPMDVAYAAAFLLSDESKYVTGHTLCVNGGLYMD